MRLELRPSRRFAAAIVAAHAAAAASAAFLVRDGWGIALAAALLALGAAAAWSRALLRGRDAARAIELSGEEGRLHLAGGQVLPVAAAKRRYVGRLFVTLPARGRTLLVSADMLAPGEFRRLRLWALWGRLPGVAAEQLAA